MVAILLQTILMTRAAAVEVIILEVQTMLFSGTQILTTQIPSTTFRLHHFGTIAWVLKLWCPNVLASKR